MVDSHEMDGNILGKLHKKEKDKRKKLVLMGVLKMIKSFALT